MRSACYAIFCLARAAADGSLLRLTPGQSQHSAQFTYDVRPRSRRDRLSFTEAQQAWIERLVAAKISEAASTSTATSMSDIVVSSGPSVVSTSSGTTVTAATTAVHGDTGEYSVIFQKKWEGTIVKKTGPETGGIQVKLYLVSMATVGRRLNGQPS